MKQQTKVRAFVLFGVFAVLALFFFNPEGNASLVKSFGPSLFGLPVSLAVTLIVYFALLPLAPAVIHLTKIGDDFHATPGHHGATTFYLYFLLVAPREPHLRKSFWFVVGGIVYLLIVVGAWIYYADTYHI